LSRSAAVWQHRPKGLSDADADGTVPNEEQLVAEQVVALAGQRALTVRISQHAAEEFWRVDVTNPGTPRAYISTTVGTGDSFMMNLIESAVSGEQVAWRHLAEWGHSSLSRSAAGCRPAVA
jgi:hypothetical protein